ncbi:flagellar basal-body rod protein FlgB [Caminicella sporogenes DSM 14501]|uniref:Flagellar basal body rod protein FlgB n=1 Tax=Caminicella sporogenes DSM 14501 TaxID=1121266 RepID=A0A1M6LDF2_9FIRM|nr:flagellar basal body rod protein FlgB [Caminicella sporogenes]RKD27794.1 flagellar basal-body rod protein FlgB [Caminicella sporogenes]SHJ69115.1 flagellar basal-body rod protein FlgB [Caminicella sporogenes DSM 14501]
MLDKTFKDISIYQKALSAAWLRNEAISNNIANVNTPGYKRKDVKFEKILKEFLNDNSFKLKTTHPKHISNKNDIEDIEIQITTEYNTSFRKDENNVNIDTEMAELAKNTIKFNALIKQLNGKLHRIKMCITDGRK